MTYKSQLAKVNKLLSKDGIGVAILDGGDQIQKRIYRSVLKNHPCEFQTFLRGVTTIMVRKDMINKIVFYEGWNWGIERHSK